MKSVRYHTPLRYPGGKQRLAPFIGEILAENELRGGTYVEPYAGGAGVAWELLAANLVSEVRLNDANRAVFAFWHSVLHETELLCRMVTDEPLTITRWKHHREIVSRSDEFDLLTLGFAFFFLNRCNRSGIIARGGVIGGLAQTGRWKMDARFNRDGLVRRIERIASARARVRLSCADAEGYLRQQLPRLPKNTLIYLDPPYFNQGKRLYHDHYAKEDHARLAEFVQTEINRPWIVSYDAVPPIERLYRNRRQRFSYRLQYSAASTYRGREILVFSDRLRLPTRSRVLSLNRGLARLAQPASPRGHTRSLIAAR